MELDHKQQNRSKWRASARRGRGRGRGVGRGRGGGGRAAHGPDLDSNYDRYVGSDDEQAGSDAAGAGADGLPVRQSQGADLQQLLAESEQFYGQAHFRYRSFIEAVDTEPPPVDVAAFEEELILEPGPLIQALSKLPLTELLGIAVPAEFLQEGSWDDPPKVTISSCTPSTQAHAQQHQAAAGTAAPQVQAQQVQQMHLPPHLRQHQQQPSGSQPQSEHPQQPQQPQPLPSTAQGRQLAGAQPSRAPPAATAASSKGEDDTDELLELLLTGKPPPPLQQPAAAGLPAAVGAGAHTAAAQASPSSAAASAPAPAKAPVARAPPSVAAAGPATAKSSAAAFDDELDALLGLGPPAAQPGAATQAAPAAGDLSKKKQSLEEWLDGF